MVFHANDLDESLARQRAMTDVLDAVSTARTDLQPVFDALARHASRLCSGSEAGVVLCEGDNFVSMPFTGDPTVRAAARVLRPIEETSTGGDAVLHRQIVHVRDLDANPHLLGTIDLPIPKLRQGSYFPTWLLEPRRRAELALVAVVAESYVLGVSTRKVEDLVQTLGIAAMSKSQVSELATSLDVTVASFWERPLDGGPYPYVWLDALALRCREGGRTVHVSTLVAVGVNADGKREVLGLEVVTGEDGAGWLAFVRGLVARGLTGVQLAISDAHPGLRAALAATLPGATWQRCRTHFMRNLLTKVPKSGQSFVATLVRTIFAQPDAELTARNKRASWSSSKGSGRTRRGS